MTEPTSDLLRIVEQFRSALLRREAGPLSTGQLVRMQRYKSLIGQVEKELPGYQAILGNEVSIVSREAIGNAGADSARLVRLLAGEGGIVIDWHRLPRDTIESLLGFLSPDGPLYERIGQLAKVNAQNVADKIVEGVGLGKGPRQIAA